MPLSGDIVHLINPYTALFGPIESQPGVIDIDLGQSNDPDVEQEVLSDVSLRCASGTHGSIQSYGETKQPRSPPMRIADLAPAKG